MKKSFVFKLLYLFWMGLVLLIPVFGGCEKEVEDMEQDVFTFREIELVSANCAVQYVGKEGFSVILNREQLMKHIPCDEILDLVNFDKEFLIVGGVNVPNYPSVLTSQKIDVNNGKLHYFINIEMGIATQPSYVSFMSAVPKEYSKMPIELITKIK